MKILLQKDKYGTLKIQGTLFTTPKGNGDKLSDGIKNLRNKSKIYVVIPDQCSKCGHQNETCGS